MNLITKANNSLILTQVFKFRSYSQTNNCHKRVHSLKTSLLCENKFNKINVNSNAKKCYSTAINVMLLGEISPFIALIFGRLIRNNFPQLAQIDSKYIFKSISDHKLKSISILSLLSIALYSIGESISEETPFTRRKRYVIFTKDDYKPISDMLFKGLKKLYKEKLLSVNHKTTKRVNKIVKNLLESNQEFKEISDKDWEVFIIKDPTVANAFILPTGQVFVFTGIINLCDNDSQLGTILAHELSHTLLGHGKEVLTHEVFADFINTFIVFLLWIRFSGFKALIGTVVTGLSLKGLSLLPKRRLLENEADYVGLVLSAKTCYDVREGSAFWMKMALNQDNDWRNILSTHPSNRLRYELMDSYMQSMIELMKSMNCPELNQNDPRNRYKSVETNSQRMVFKRKKV